MKRKASLAHEFELGKLFFFSLLPFSKPDARQNRLAEQHSNRSGPPIRTRRKAKSSDGAAFQQIRAAHQDQTQGKIKRRSSIPTRSRLSTQLPDRARMLEAALSGDVPLHPVCGNRRIEQLALIIALPCANLILEGSYEIE
ncbi:MAG: hypothetical protein HXX20_05290 [Chloroflexi bacterium]|nr:hypothetical protein [Chloroflexota bacterium]